MTVRKRPKSRRFAGSRLTNIAAAAILATGLVISASLLRSSRSSDSERFEPRVVAEYDTIEIPVPVNFVEAGTRLGAIEFKTIPFPKTQVPEGALIDLIGLEDSTTIAPLPANLPLFLANLNVKGDYVNPVIERIPSGMRAITIRVDETTVVEGWAGSGAIVDVLLVENDRTIVVAEQVKILSTERSIRPVAVEEGVEVPSTVTLLVSQEQALAINTAVPRGRISFALRGFQDDSGWNDRIFTSERFARGSNGAKRVDVNGYVRVLDGSAYALAEGKWIQTEVKPQGFFPAKNERSD